jgi:hypothetical protein
MIEQLKEMIRELAEDDEIMHLVARAMRKFYNSLIDAGFTPEQAMEIIISQGLGFKANQ